MPNHFWETQIEFLVCTCYAPREEFISRDSIFTSWVMVAPESGGFSWESHRRDGTELAGEAAFGDLVCIAPNLPFNRHVTSRMSSAVLQWNFRDGHGRPVEPGWPLGQSRVRDTVRLSAIFQQLKIQSARNDGWSKRRQVHLLEEMLHLAWQTRLEREVLDPAMRQAARLLCERAGENFAMNEISDEFGLGPVQFTRRFRAAHGRNPIEWLTQIRLENAQKMLIETACSLDEIAFRCGWASGAYLSHVFKKHLQTTPGEFRKRHRI